MKIRPASSKDWQAIRALIEENPETLAQDHLPRAKEFFVAVEHKKVIGCCALVVYSKRLAEVRSLAVSSETRGKRIGAQLVDACVAHAQEKGVRELLAITGENRFFEKHGFSTLRREKLALLRPLKD